MNIFEESRKLAYLLKEHNQETFSQELLDALKYSSTGTEIIMKLKFYINNFLAENQKTDDGSCIIELAKDILIEIEKE